MAPTRDGYFLSPRKVFLDILREKRRGGVTFRYFLLILGENIFTGSDLTDKDGTTLTDYLQWKIVSIQSC